MLRVGESATGRMTRREQELREAGRQLVGLGAGEPHFRTPERVIRAAEDALRAGLTRYTAVAGITDLRQELAEKYAARGAPWTAQDVVVSVGAKAALLELALALFDEGDEVVLPAPCWVSLPEQVRLAGADPVLVPSPRDRGYPLEAGPLIAAMTPRTRAMLINSPCNPTGACLSAEGMAELAGACAARGVLLISDETYEHFVYDGRAHASAAAVARQHPETVVVVGSFSKTWAMTGWRVGWAVGPRDIMGAVAAVQSHATSNAPTFAMHAALEALREPHEELAARVAEYERRRDQMVRGLEANPALRCLTPAGAFYVFADLSPALAQGRFATASEVADHLLEEVGVVTVPGEAFGDASSLRLSYACDEETLREGLQRLEAAFA